MPPKRSSSCKALQNFSFPKQQSISEPCSPHDPLTNDGSKQITNSTNKFQTFSNLENSSKLFFEEPKKDLKSELINNHNVPTQFSIFRPRRNSLQKDSEPLCLRSRSSSPQFWKFNAETLLPGSSNNCKSFWKKLEKCSMEDLSARHTPSPVRPASVAFYPKTPEPVTSPKNEVISPKKKVKG